MCLLFICISWQVQADTPQILILNSFDESAAPYFRPTEEFKKRLQQNYAEPVAFRDIDLDLRGHRASNHLDATLTQLMLGRFSDLPPQLVVAVGPPAIQFWVNNRDSIFPDARLVAMARESILRQTPLQAGDAAVATSFSFTGVVENILKLKPSTRDIVMIFGSSPADRVLANSARMELSPWSTRLNLEFTSDLPIHQIQKLLTTLQPDSAVFYGIFTSDVNGVSLEDYAALTLFRTASTVPFFGAFDDQLGRGIIGGKLIQSTEVGRELAEVAKELLDEPTASVAWKIVDLSQPTYDWRELQAWGIDIDDLPDGSTILFEPPTLWQQYASWILWATFIILAQTMLLVGLLWQRQRRRNAELAYASLGRRLITAHEDERRLLARELHDDLSQRLARASMDASFAQSNHGTEAANEALQNLQPELVRISKDVHDMSYRLHPSLVEDLGLVAALHSEIEKAKRRTSVSITQSISEIQEQLSPDKALSIYRIAQEALQNAIKHAQANRIEIALQQDIKGLMLSVIDNGAGFDVASVHKKFSLGLSSMQERAKLVNGRLKITSRPGAGTQVTLSVPVSGGSS